MNCLVFIHPFRQAVSLFSSRSSRVNGGILIIWSVSDPQAQTEHDIASGALTYPFPFQSRCTELQAIPVLTVEATSSWWYLYTLCFLSLHSEVEPT
jgi:hypothetical protein